jgi:hypothetical protein
MRTTYVFRQDDKGEWQAIKAEKAPPSAASIVVLEDTMPMTWHPVNGQYYDSKSKFRQVTKAHGCVEAGNDLKTKDGGFRGLYSRPKQESIREAIAKAARGDRPSERN